MRLDELVRERYESGAHSRCHLVMHAATRDALRTAYSPDAPVLTGAVSTLTGIPIVLDNSVPVDVWRLVNTNTGEVLEGGFVTPDPLRVAAWEVELRQTIAADIRREAAKVAVRAESEAGAGTGAADDHPFVLGCEFAARIAEGARQ